MPLSQPIDRKLIHQRDIKCYGYQRSDGLWDIEGHLVDTKTYEFDNKWRGSVKPSEPLHEMWLRLTINDELEVVHAEAKTDHSPYPECPHFPNNLEKLVGVKIAPGWSKAVQNVLGGVNGCTHITEVLGRVANVAFQTVMPFTHTNESRSITDKRPRIINTCHALNSTGDVVKREWPQFHIDTNIGS
ncbi:MAG: DUF2889 domain-containing protein [Gammaproteobacteria bacterium]|nr:DUF2889 domain-containing protein [Gammaproteobacteria bacterium]